MAVSVVPSPVITITGKTGRSCLMSAKASSPLMRGKQMSITTRSQSSLCNRARASSALPAISTWCPRAESSASNALGTAGSSSTTRILAIGLCLCDWYPNGKRGALRPGRFQDQPPVVRRHDAGGDAQSQPRAVLLGAEKRLESPAADLLVHAAARIAHSHDDHPPVLGVLLGGGQDADLRLRPSSPPRRCSTG